MTIMATRMQQIATSMLSAAKNGMTCSRSRYSIYSTAIHSTAYEHAKVSLRDDAPIMEANAASFRKRLDVALVGAPNAGKSQLLNSLTGAKVAAVSRKRHTTRSGILGARTQDNTQIVFIDTPGFLHHTMGAKEGVRKLLGEASSEMEGSDYTVLVVDAAKNIGGDLERTLITLMFLALRSKGRNEHGVRSSVQNPSEGSALLDKFVIVLNKVDLVNPKEKLLMLVAHVGSMAESCIRKLLQQRRNPVKVRLGDLVESVLQTHTSEHGFENVHEDDIELFTAVLPQFLFTSAIQKNDEGVADLLKLLFDRATPSDDWVVDPRSPTGMSPLEQLEEIIREKLYRCLHREVPHCVRQQNRMFRTRKPDHRKPNSDDEEGGGQELIVHQDLIVQTKSHQRLVTGSGGKTLERIRSTAQRDLEENFACPVDLQLHVKVSKLNQEVTLESDSEGARLL